MKSTVTDRSYVLQNNATLFDATLDEFSVRDFEAASLNEILKRSGFNKGSFYYRFSDKFELYAALLETVFSRHAELIKEGTKTIIDVRGVETSLAAMVSSIVRLHAMDPRHLALYGRLFDELGEHRANLLEILRSSPIERLLTDLSSLLSSEGVPDRDASFFASMVRMTLYHLDRLAMIDGVWVDAASMAHAIIRSSFPDDSLLPRRVRDSAHIVPRLDPAGTSPLPFDLSFASGEIVALVGDRQAGKAALRTLLTGVLSPRSGEVRFLSPDLVKSGTDGFATVPSGIRLNRSPRWHLRQVGLKPGSERESGLLADLGLEDVADIRLDRLPDAAKTKTEFARLFASDAKVLVIDDALGGLNPDARERICRMLLKRRHVGNTIILYTSSMEEALGIADRIAFLLAEGVARVVSAEELNRKYGQKSIVVDYQEDGLAHRTRFPWDALSGTAFSEFIAGNRILGIETRAMSGAEIFKMETGAELS